MTAPTLEATGLPRLVSAFPALLWLRSAPRRLLVCAPGVEPSTAHLPPGTDPFELGGFAVVEGASPAACCGSRNLLSAGRAGGTLLAVLHTDGDPLAALTHVLRAGLGPLPEQGRLWLLGLLAGEVAGTDGMPRPRRLLLWGDPAGRPLAWSRVPQPGGQRLRALVAGWDRPFWFDHRAAAGESERSLQLQPGHLHPSLIVSSEAPEPAMVAQVAEPLLGLLEEGV